MAASPFRPATELLVQYALYHRDRRNILSHFIGIPLIVLAIGVLLARVPVGPTNLSWIVCALAALWYLGRGLPLLGAATVVVNTALIALAQPLAGGSTASWLGWGLGLFVVGWVIQFVGHYWEGRKPAFVDDLVGLLVGPMFVVAEWLFALGWGRALAAEITARAGPERRSGHGAGGAPLAR
ncbi:Mpo1 family 2-hydroxy fatty acid dioxygenase [Aquabacterium sp. OR-4]|uniref:Mpo1 family 2-hydroxy fatty acid dioxygenase n=1 Tax=Aquabacterium sp. OR-4 TaxID=2978127 RepID=UPI0021B3A79E|nr:Mpo1-like protein [Aquabacterium sp. OR-4]MDT7835649.1 Mpo1-like protein [Aquabacterium sp. OR-4]